MATCRSISSHSERFMELWYLRFKGSKEPLLIGFGSVSWNATSVRLYVGLLVSKKAPRHSIDDKSPTREVNTLTLLVFQMQTMHLFAQHK